MIADILLFGSIAIFIGCFICGIFEKRSDCRKQEQQQSICYKMNWQTALGVGICLLLLLWGLLIECDPAILK